MNILMLNVAEKLIFKGKKKTDILSQELKENASQIVKENITSNEQRFPYTQQSKTIFPDDPGGIGQ